MTAAELAAAGITPIARCCTSISREPGTTAVEKVEGLALVDADTIAVINDNDFGVAGIVIDNATGTFTLRARLHPGAGAARPDRHAAASTPRTATTSSTSATGRSTACTSPTRIADFKARRRSATSSPPTKATRATTRDSPRKRGRATSRATYPGSRSSPTIRSSAGLTFTERAAGRRFLATLRVRHALVLDLECATGALVWDSGADFEVRTAAAFPRNFNSNNDANDFDNRSDNKGPEPEGVAVGGVHGRTYAFVGLERIGGVMVYDVTDPSAPSSCSTSTPRLRGCARPRQRPRDRPVRRRHDSPTGSAAPVVSNEITGTVSTWRLAD